MIDGLRGVSGIFWRTSLVLQCAAVVMMGGLWIGPNYIGRVVVPGERFSNKSHGVTLIELLITISIIAIMAAIGIPSYARITTTDRLASETNSLSSVIRLARLTAIEQGIATTLCASSNATSAVPSCSGQSDWSKGWILFTDQKNNQTYSAAAGDQLVRHGNALQSGDTASGIYGTPGATGTAAGFFSFTRMGGTTAGIISIHDKTNDAALNHCLVIARNGSVSAYNASENPGVCP